MDLISIGECMVEFSCDGRLAEATTFRKSYGGDTLNTLVAASRLGSRTAYITKVGNDPFGEYLFRSWEEEGIDLSHTERTEGFNGIYFISLDEGGEYEFTYYRKGSAASQLDPGSIDEAFVTGTEILHSTGITQAISGNNREYVRRAFRLAHSSGVRVSYDPNFRPKLWGREEAGGALEEVLGEVEIALPSRKDVTSLLGLREVGEIADFFWDRGVRVLALKDGERGCYLCQKGRVEKVLSPPVKVVDTTGAGDAFNGAFLHGLLRGDSPREAALLGVVVASLKVQGRGAVASLPRREEVEAAYSRLRAGRL
jgi:2-dehydro-3-deoxygluconokinase